MTIARDARVAKIRTSWSRLRGVTLDDGQRIAGRVVISGLDEGDGIQVEGWTRRPRSGVLPPSPYRAFTIHLLVGRHVLPEGLGPRAVLARDSAEPLVGSNHVIVSRGPIAEDVCRLALTFRVPSDASAETRQKTGREAIDHLREVVPFLDDDLRGVFPPLETPEDLRPDRKQSDPWAVARGPLAVNGPGAATPTARFDTSIGHLLKTGATTLPGFGYEGELLAGVSAGRRALKLVGRRH